MCLISSKKGAKKKTAPHGYWKDLLNILALATVDELRPKLPLHPRSTFLHNYYDGKSRPAFKNNQEQEEWSRTQRIQRSRRARDRLGRRLLDKRYRALYVAVARLFAGQLAKDYDVMTKISALPVDADKKDCLTLMHALTLVPSGLRPREVPMTGSRTSHLPSVCSSTRPKCLLRSPTGSPSLSKGPCRRLRCTFSVVFIRSMFSLAGDVTLALLSLSCRPTAGQR